jgi:hypothetical protein
VTSPDAWSFTGWIHRGGASEPIGGSLEFDATTVTLLAGSSVVGSWPRDEVRFSVHGNRVTIDVAGDSAAFEAVRQAELVAHVNRLSDDEPPPAEQPSHATRARKRPLALLAMFGKLPWRGQRDGWKREGRPKIGKGEWVAFAIVAVIGLTFVAVVWAAIQLPDPVEDGSTDLSATAATDGRMGTSPPTTARPPTAIVPTATTSTGIPPTATITVLPATITVPPTTTTVPPTTTTTTTTTTVPPTTTTVPPTTTTTTVPPTTTTTTVPPTTTTTTVPPTTTTPPSAVVVHGISPDQVATGGTLTGATITGSGFGPNATVTFSGGDGPTPLATNVTVDPDGGIWITLDVVTTDGGPRRDRSWHITVTNSDSSSGTALNAFTITVN